MTWNRPRNNLLGGSEVVTVNTFTFNKRKIVCTVCSILARVTYFFDQWAQGLTEISVSHKRKSLKEKAYFIEETEIETEIIEEIEIEIDQNAPPPDYDEIEFVSTAVPKQTVDQTSVNGLPAYDDIHKDSFF